MAAYGFSPENTEKKERIFYIQTQNGQKTQNLSKM